MDNKIQESLSQLEKNLNDIQSAVELVTKAGETSDEVISELKNSQIKYLDILDEVKSQFKHFSKESDSLSKRNRELQKTVDDFRERNEEIQKKIAELNLAGEIEKVESTIKNESQSVQSSINESSSKIDKVNHKQEEIHKETTQQFNSVKEILKQIDHDLNGIKGNLDHLHKANNTNRLIISIGMGLILAAVLANAYGII